MSPVSPWYKVTLRRSTIGLPETTRNVALSIGLTRLHKAILLPVAPKSAGIILKLKELVEIENVALPRGTSPKSALDNIKAARKPFPGYKVVGSALPNSW